MIKSALCTVLLVATATPAFAEKPEDVLDLNDPKLASLLMRDSDGHIVRRPHTCGTVTSPNHSAERLPGPAAALGEPQVIYMNKNGASFTTAGTTSAANNTVVAADGFKSGTVTPLNTQLFDWPFLVSCVAEAFAPFNITVTETEPTGVPYVEAVVGGNDGSEIYNFGGGGLFGVAATDQFCSLFRTGIAFNFAGTHADLGSFKNPELCSTIAHEVGHVLGLYHKAWRRDMMSYDLTSESGCTPNMQNCKSFVNTLNACGVYQGSPQSCNCNTQGGSQTNTYAILADFVGLANVVPDTAAPTLSITAPTDFSSMPRDFDVTVAAMDNIGVTSVTLLVDDTQVDTATAPSSGSNYILSVADATEGTHTLVARALDEAGNMQDTTVEFTVVLAQTGDECTTNEECSGGICAQSSSGRFCTEECSGDSCPTDFSCTTISSGEMICVPDPAGTDDGDDMTDADDNTDGNNATDDGDGGGCCSTSSGTGALSGGLLALGVGLVVSRRRRR